MTALRVKTAGSGGVVEADDDTEPGDGPHSHLDMLIIRLIDAVNENTWAVFQSQSEEEVSRPEPLPRPGVSRKRVKPRHEPADPLLVEWLTRRQNGEDTSDLDELLEIDTVSPLRPYTLPGGDDGGPGEGSQP